MRLRFSNEFGDAPLRLAKVRVARALTHGCIEPSSACSLTFDGRPSVTLAAGTSRFSDPVDYPLHALSKLAISICFGEVPRELTGHPGSRTTSYLERGDVPDLACLGGARVDHWYVISGIDVLAPQRSHAIVVLGDSITDGRGSTTNGNDRWPDQLARRLQSDTRTAHISILNQGIGGNALVRGGLGPTALARFERDVLLQSGARFVIVLEGINDIGESSHPSIASELVRAYRKLIRAAHRRGLDIYGVPLLPMAGSDYDHPDREAARRTVNDWIRTSGEFDAVLDLESAVRDPRHPARLLPEYDSGDHLHLNARGYHALANAIDLALFLA